MDVQADLFEMLTRQLGVDVRLDAWRQVVLPASAQMVLAGWVVLADWLASSEPLLGDDTVPGEQYEASAWARACGAAEMAGWGRLWTPGTVPQDADSLFQARFGRAPRDVQRVAVELAWSLPGPALIVAEAPPGEGKSELAWAVSEVLAFRFGARGLFVGLPTQSTADQMFSRTAAWLGRAGGGGIALAHGKARWNPQFAELLEMGQLCCVGIDGGEEVAVEASRWFAGRNRALLESVVVGTVDQLLLAATPSRFVALRHAALAGKVVILDEVHAYDAYMSVFLRRALQWLGAAGVPVILLSATLPAAVRNELVAAYAGRSSETLPDVGYPGVLAVPAPGGAGIPAPSERPPRARGDHPIIPSRTMRVVLSAPRTRGSSEISK